MKIVKAAVVLLVGLLLVTASACGGGSGQGANPTPTPTSSWAIYASSLGFSIQYPQDWMRIERQLGIVAFFSPWADELGPHGEFSIFVSGPFSVSLSDYVEKWISRKKESSESFNLSESSTTTIAGMPAYKVIYTYEVYFPDDSKYYPVKTMEILFVKDNTVYMVSYAAHVNFYTEYLGTAQQMIDSFKFY